MPVPPAVGRGVRKRANVPEYDETDPSDTITEAPAEAEPTAPETASTSRRR